MRRAAIFVGLAAAAGTFAALAPSPTSTRTAEPSELTKMEQHYLEQLNTPFKGGTKGGSAWNMAVVGKNDIGGRGYNADVWAHEGYAYVGQWGFNDWASGSKQRFCPEGANAGVAVIDASDPANPTVVSRLVNPAGTSVEDVVVETMRWGPYAGRDVAAVGAQTCGSTRYDRALFRGLILYDVTDPTKPVELGRLNTGCCTRGLHELEVNHRPDLERTFVYASVPAGNYPDPDTASGVRDENGKGDFRLIDITNPATPVETAEWGIRDIGGPFYAGQGCDADANYGHSAEPSADGRTVFLSYWDSGFIALDVTNPSNPVFKGRTVYPANADGDGHSSMYDDGRKLLFAADEDFCKTSGSGIEKGFGYLRIFDYSNLAAPEQIGMFKTVNSSGTTDPGAGDYTIHNPMLMGTDVYISWYTDGVRVVDASDPRAPREVAYFVPPAGQNPVKPSQRGTLSNTTQVWGVYVDHHTGLVYASDMNTGLWILRRTDG
jgi:hypothetical protein